MHDRPECELDYLTGLVELYHDDSVRARKAAALVQADAFTCQASADLYATICDTLAIHDSPTIADLRQHPRYEQCRSEIVDLVTRAHSSRCGYSLGVERYAWYIRAAWKRRLVRAAADDLRAAVDDGKASVADVMAAAKAVQDAAENVENAERMDTLTDAIDEWLKMDATPVVRTGFQPVDSLCGGGLPVGGLFVLAAPPSVGKSALALQLVLGALECDRGLSAVWCMGEMTKEAFARRAICHWSTRGTMHRVAMSSAEQRTDLAKGAAVNMAIHVAGRLSLVTPPLTIQKIEQAVLEKKARLVVVDYVQLVELEGAQDRRSEVDGIVKRLRRLSLEHGVATVCVSNIAKAVAADTRIGAIGKESSELDFAADVMLLGVHDAAEDAGGLRQVRWACKKNRHGPCEDIVAAFDGRLQTFTAAMASREDAFDNWGDV